MALALVATISSCKTVSKSHTADYDYMFISKQGILQKPMITDLEVAKQKVTVTKTYENISLSEAKQNVMGEFIKQNSCDLIVQPYFTSSAVTANEKTTITINVTGYPASYKNIRNFEAKDTAYFFRGINFGNGTINKLASAEPAAPEAKKSSGSGLATLGLLSLLRH